MLLSSDAYAKKTKKEKQSIGYYQDYSKEYWNSAEVSVLANELKLTIVQITINGPSKETEKVL